MVASQEVPPGDDPAVLDGKTKTKSAKRNERKKEKRLEIRLAEEGQQQKNGEKDLTREQLEKLAKVEGWRQELKILEEVKAKSLSS